MQSATEGPCAHRVQARVCLTGTLGTPELLLCVALFERRFDDSLSVRTGRFGSLKLFFPARRMPATAPDMVATALVTMVNTAAHFTQVTGEARRIISTDEPIARISICTTTGNRFAAALASAFTSK